MAIRYLLTFANKDRQLSRQCPKRPDIIKKCYQLFDRYITSDIASAREIADIVSNYVNDDTLIDRLRVHDEAEEAKEEVEAKVPQRLGMGPLILPAKKTKTVYQDSQNVHNSTINKTVFEIARNLCHRYSHILEASNSDEENFNIVRGYILKIRQGLIQRYLADQEAIISSTDSILTNTTNINGVTMPKTFLAVWLWMLEQNDFDIFEQLMSRLVEELKEMNGFCTTGYFARIINIIQGFTEDTSLTIRISNKDQCIAVVRTYLNKQLANCPDEKVLDGMLTHNDEFKLFIRQKIAERLLEWKKEYGDSMLDYIANEVNSFCGMKVFS